MKLQPFVPRTNEKEHNMEHIDVQLLDPATTIVVATGNRHKLIEISDILGSVLPEITFVALNQLGNFDDPDENGDTFLENSLIKAEAAVAATGFSAIADDSGLIVDALNGAPGVFSARYAGTHGDDEANNAKLLKELEEAGAMALPDRRARFASVVTLINRSGRVTYGEGYCEGYIGFSARGDNGFGYDPLFLPDDTPGKTMAELSSVEKNAISHRFHALKELANQLCAENI